jgi:glycosyltransferase involved in cell wall biosynthesis
MPDQGPTVELTILMPCLNEAETLADCIDQARDFLARQRIDGEVLIADNGSTDGSIHIAEAHGARVVHVARKGYGAALMHGMRAARGTYLIFGDCDRSYDFSRLEPFVERLRAGYDLVMGNRFLGGITRGAMPWLHKYVGNPVLSYLGRLFFAVPVGDFHCGLRGLRRERVLGLGLRTGHGVRERDDRACGPRRVLPLPKFRPHYHPTGDRGHLTCGPGATAGAICASC